MARINVSFQAALVRKDDLRKTNSEKSVINISLVVSNRKKLDDGTWVDDEDSKYFINASAFDRLAEGIDRTLEPGDRVIGSGTLKKKREWKDKSGVIHNNDLEILLDSLAPDLAWSTVDIDRSYRKNNNGGAAAPQTPRRPAAAKAAPAASNDPFAGDFDDFDSDDSSDELIF